jgi:hypothetical protein
MVNRNDLRHGATTRHSFVGFLLGPSRGSVTRPNSPAGLTGQIQSREADVAHAGNSSSLGRDRSACDSDPESLIPINGNRYLAPKMSSQNSAPMTRSVSDEMAWGATKSSAGNGPSPFIGLISSDSLPDARSTIPEKVHDGGFVSDRYAIRHPSAGPPQCWRSDAQGLGGAVAECCLIASTGRQASSLS